MQPSIFDQLFVFSAKKRSKIISVFKLVYIALLSVLIIGGWLIYQQDNNYGFFYTFGISAGRTALVVYIITLIPGITRRFGFGHRLIQLIMIFRRYIGITMYLLTLIHYSYVRGINLWFRKMLVFPPPLFEFFGTLAFFLLFFMFATSNDPSTKTLGKNWQRIHNVTYVVVWLIFLHVALQRVSIWTVLIGSAAVLQVSSHIFYNWKNKSINASPQT